MNNLKYIATIFCVFFACLFASFVRPDLPVWLIFAVSLISVISVKLFESAVDDLGEYYEHHSINHNRSH